MFKKIGIFFVLASLSKLISSQQPVRPCPGDNDELLARTCFEFVELPLDNENVDYNTAMDYCQRRNKTLAIVETPEEQKLLADKFVQLNWQRGMIGLKYVKSGWKWADRSPLLLRGQGCHGINGIDTSKLSSDYSQMMSNDGCIAYCTKAGNKYAAVMAGSFCYCSTDFIWRQPASVCDIPCSGEPRQTCGSYTNSYVFYTAEFSFDNWVSGHPAVEGSCAAIKVDRINNKWVDASCTYGRPFLCQYGVNDLVPDIGNREMTCGNNDTCYYLYTSPQLPWSEAHRFCTKSGGFLATVDSQERQDMVNTLVTRLRNVTEIWIGANNYDWYFPDNTIPNFRGWISADEPTFPNVHSCAEAVMGTLPSSVGPTFGWKSRTCGVRNGLPNRFICSTPAKFPLTTTEQPGRTRRRIDTAGGDDTLGRDYNYDILEPGRLMNAQRPAPVKQSAENEEDRSLQWWHKLLIILAALIVLAIITAILVIIHIK